MQKSKTKKITQNWRKQPPPKKPQQKKKQNKKKTKKKTKQKLKPKQNKPNQNKTKQKKPSLPFSHLHLDILSVSPLSMWMALM